VKKIPQTTIFIVRVNYAIGLYYHSSTS